MDIKDDLHFYIGCEGIFKGYENPLQITGISADSFYIKFSNGDSKIRITHLVDFKPILRPLSDMTEGHTHEIADELKIVTSNVFLWMQAALKGGCCYFDTQVKFINALRKRGYDCDGLIDAGLAIDKTKI